MRGKMENSSVMTRRRRRLAPCEKCNETINSAHTSEISVPDSVSVANIRTVASARNCGLGYTRLIQFLAGASQDLSTSVISDSVISP